jgi:hypothetical protein
MPVIDEALPGGCRETEHLRGRSADTSAAFGAMPGKHQPEWGIGLSPDPEECDERRKNNCNRF